MKGKFIVIYGANNLGKTKQAKLLVEELKKKGRKVRLIKYPIYNLEPTGGLINDVLRKGLVMNEKRLQKIYAQNRRDFEGDLIKLLDKGYTVVAEDYTGTGIAWGMVRGLSIDDLEKMNSDLLKEDLGIMLDGERFKKGVESTHRNEIDDELWQSSRKIHLKLAKRYKWKIINANQKPLLVHKDIMRAINGE
jgi:thymidylate kinase